MQLDQRNILEWKPLGQLGCIVCQHGGIPATFHCGSICDKHARALMKGEVNIVQQ